MKVSALPMALTMPVNKLAHLMQSSDTPSKLELTSDLKHQ